MTFINHAIKPYKNVGSLASLFVSFVVVLNLTACVDDPAPKLPGTVGGPVITDSVAVPYYSTKDSLAKQRTAILENHSSIHCEAVYDSTYQWGYNIYMDTKVFISQKTIPGSESYQGFTTKAAALKTGNFVAWKLLNNIMPPTVTRHELDSLQVI